MMMKDWAKHLDRILQADGNELLTNVCPVMFSPLLKGVRVANALHRHAA
jgi:hypothetical protein